MTEPPIQAQHVRRLADVGDDSGAGDEADRAEAGPGDDVPVPGEGAQQGGQEPGQPPLQGKGGEGAEL